MTKTTNAENFIKRVAITEKKIEVISRLFDIFT